MLPDRIVEQDASEMVLVPAGPFRRGREDVDIFARGDERPAATIELGAFYIDVHPITNEQVEEFVDDGGYDRPDLWSDAGWRWRRAEEIETPLSFETDGFDGRSQPAAGVSWYEADAYARWVGRRLPTEAEWEKAARGPDARLFPWGEAFPHAGLCNYGGRVGQTTPVGAYDTGVSYYGCHDMAGNVNNWCSDWYLADAYARLAEAEIDRDPHLDDATAERLEIERPKHRTDRGGGYATPALHWEVLATTGRNHWLPGERALWNGFRTAKSCDPAATG